MTLDIEAEIHDRIAAIETEPQASANPDDVKREILYIQDTIHTTAVEERDGVLRTVAQIECIGIPTPNSSVQRGIVRFRPNGDMKAPYYKAEDGIIRVWLSVAHLEHVLFQISHRNRFLWIGIWPDGYTYADLHSRP